MNILLIGDWFIGVIATFFVTLLDWVAYTLLTVSYNIFDAVSQIDLFGGSTAGQELYNNITKNVYVALSIVMVFMFAYQLVMMIIDPDGKAKGSSHALVKDTIISIILLIMLPLVYKYMALFQYHVLNDGTIPAIIMGTNASNSDNSPGKNVAMMTYISFYHPNNSTYSTFFDESGNIRSDAQDACVNNGASDEICTKFISAITTWHNSSGIGTLTSNYSIRTYIGEDSGMEYYWFLATAAGLAAAYFFFCYAFDIGIRAVKLGVLELVSPIPIVLKIFPKTRKSFDNWFRVIKKTYLELFVRVAVIYFGLELLKLIPTFIKILMASNDNINSDTFSQGVATVILILSIMGFCKQAPQLFKEVFDMGGDLLKGLDLKGGVKRRAHDDTTIIHKPVSAIGGAVGQFARQYHANRNTEIDGGSNRIRAVVGALPSFRRGLVSGFTTKQDDNQSLREAFSSGVDTARNNFSESARLQRKSQATANLAQNTNLSTLGQNIVSGFYTDENSFIHLGEKAMNKIGEEGKDLHSRLIGETTGNATLSNINAATATIDKILKLAGDAGEIYDKAWTDLQKDLIKGKEVEYGGTKYSYKNGNVDALEETFKKQKNAAIASKMTPYKDTSLKTYMETLTGEFNKTLNGLDREAVDRITSKCQPVGVKDTSGASITTIDDFIKKFSEGKVQIDSNAIATMNAMKKSLNIESKNIVAQEEKKKETPPPPTSNNGGKPK